MKAKKTSVPSARRTQDGKKPGPKKPMPKKVSVNNSTALKSLSDEYWQINITINNERGVQLGGLTLRPAPPPPPFVPGDLIGWVRDALGS